MTSTAPPLSAVEAALVECLLDHTPPDHRLPVALLTKEQKAAELQRVQARRAVLAAYEAELVLGLADESPDADDPPPGRSGARRGGWAPDGELPGVSEFFTAELAVVLNCGRGTASHLAQRVWTWRENLPATWAALASGELDEPRAKALAEVLAHASPAVARAIEAELLPRAPGLSLGRLRKRALELLLERDAAGADERREQAERSADVRTYPSHLDGMATLAADLPAPVAAACSDVVDQLARMLRADGDPRPIGQLRAAVLADLVLRPWDDSRPAVTARLTVSAALASLRGDADRTGEVDGLPITVAHVRELLRRLGALGVRAPEGGTLTLAVTDGNGGLLATAGPGQLERLARRGCPTHREVDCGCPVLDRPPPTGSYRPTDAQRVWVRTRDGGCRFPNCGQRVGWADLDHVVPHACGGETACVNLCCLCRSHHRLKTFARGWRLHHGRRRHAGRHHAVRDHAHDPSTGDGGGSGRATGSTRGGDGLTRRRPAALLTRHRSAPGRPRHRAGGASRPSSSAITPGYCSGRKWVPGSTRSRAPGSRRAAARRSATSTRVS
jgi:hypothetical protein